MKKYIQYLLNSLLFIVFYVGSCTAQYISEWQHCIGGAGYDIAYSVINTSDGHLLMAGYTNSSDGDITVAHGSNDAFIAKFDTLGAKVWVKSFGGTNSDGFYSLKQTLDGGYIAAGWTKSNDGDVSGNHSVNINDVWVVKLDTAGIIEWQKCFGGSLGDFAKDIIQLADSSYVIAGTASSYDGDVTGNTLLPGTWLLKINNSGVIQWQHTNGGFGENNFFKVASTTDGGFIATGRTDANDGDVTGNHGGSYDIWVMKTDSNGILQWQKCLGGSETDIASGIIQTTDGGYLISGNSNSIDGDVTNPHGSDDGWVIKLTSSGNIQWQKTLGGSSYDYVYSANEDAGNTYLVTGTGGSYDGDVGGTNGSYDGWAVKLDASGNIIGSFVLGGNQMDVIWGHVQTSANKIAIAGFTESANMNSTANHGGGDGWIAVLNTDFSFNTITGNVFIDLNSNNLFDSTEIKLTNKTIVEQQTGRLGFCNSNGYYKISVFDSGSYSVAPQPLIYYSAIPTSHTVTFNGINLTDSLNDFAFQPAGNFNNLRIFISPVTPFRSGFNAMYALHYENIGTTTLNASIVYYLNDTNYTFVSSTTAPSLVTSDSIVWGNITLAPFQSGDITVTVHVDTGVPIGTQLNAFCKIEPVAGDAFQGDNYGSWKVFTVGSFDPNDILVDEDTLTTVQLAGQPYLEYIIRFQNTGNDTAFIVKILNPIDTNMLELNTIEFVASSHPVNLKWIPWERNMEFKFDNILLPDSNINEPLSHGYVRYRINPKTNLVAGDTIKNNAAIYFDFNSPVITNTATTIIVLPTGIPNFLLEKSQGCVIYPNPTADNITISFTLHSPQKASLKIYDINGRCVATLADKTFNAGKNNLTCNVRNLENGIYFLRFQTETIIENKKLVIQR